MRVAISTLCSARWKKKTDPRMSVRLTLALEEGTLVLTEEGAILVDTPPTDFDLSALDRGRVVIRHGFRPDFDVWAARGYSVSHDLPEAATTAVVVLPRSKALGRAMIAEAAALTDGVVIVDGTKTDGVDSLLKDVRKRCPVLGPVNKAHGKLFWFEADAGLFDDWRSTPSQFDGFTTRPGVFSSDGVDPASQILLEHLPRNLGARVADLGAGWGFLSASVLRSHSEVEELHLVEADRTSLDCARSNVTDARARFHWADARSWSPSDRVSSVIMNPPFHVSRAADPALGQAFIANAARIVSASGGVWLVANRHLPYEASLTSLFRDVAEVGGDKRFKVLHAQRPKQKRS